jgi:tryptophan synthase beta chain
MMVRNFHRIIGLETRGQILQAEGRLPDRLVACVGGGSNAAGFFHPFLDEPGVRMTGVEAAGLGVTSGKTAATLTKGKPGVLHGSLSYLLQTPAGQVDIAHSISAGLDYPGIGPEHSHWFATGRVDYASATDDEALQAVERLSRMEGIIPALETAHAFAWLETGLDRDRDRLVVFNCSGRGDKDMGTIMDARSREGGPTHG